MKSQVIRGNGKQDHGRARGIEGQMMRGMGEVWQRWEEVASYQNSCNATPSG